MFSRALLAILLASGAAAADYDVMIRHGRIIDGTGNPARFADVGVKTGT